MKAANDIHDRASKDSLHILVETRIGRVTRIVPILAVAQNLMKNYPLQSFDITIVGDEELKNTLEEQCRFVLLPIKFIGWVDSVSKYYQEADILSFTSDTEGTPLTFMEAASFGCPIISSNVGSVADLIDD